MPAWLKVTKPNVEVGANFVFFQSAILNLEQASGFAIQAAGSVTVYIDGKAFVIQQQHDARAYQAVLNYAHRVTGQPLE